MAPWVPHDDRGGMPAVLLVDDTDLVRGLMTVALESAGHEVIAAGLPSEALEVASAHGAVDVLVADLVMPEMDAFELAEQLTSKFPSLRVLYVSGYADASTEGAFLAKPFTPAQLTQAVAALAA
jgi:two-component system cell cycle sensor histidine kinase/response regulator CckA